MSTTQLIVIIVLALILLALIIYAVVPKGNKSKQSPPANNTPTVTPTNNNVPVNTGACTAPDTYGSVANVNLDESKPLSLNSTGPEVAALQALLRSRGQCITRDGNFGPQTQSALVAVMGQNYTSLAAIRTFLGTNNASGGASSSSGATAPTAAFVKFCDDLSYFQYALTPACWNT